MSFVTSVALLATHMEPDDHIICPVPLHHRLSLLKPFKIPCLFPKPTAAHHYVSNDYTARCVCVHICSWALLRHHSYKTCERFASTCKSVTIIKHINPRQISLFCSLFFIMTGIFNRTGALRRFRSATYTIVNVAQISVHLLNGNDAS